MALRLKVPETAGLRRSVEVQHARKGFLLMLRRGLHGAKNWTLEREEDGSHRSVWAKVFRVFVVFTPLWIVLSAVTGGPQRGGHSASVGQSLFMALLVLVVGLAVFSARERKQGREEPWSELEGPEFENTESDGAGDGAPEELSMEAPTAVLENPQVDAVSSVNETSFRPDENDESEQKTQILPFVVPQAIQNDDAHLAVTGQEGTPEPIHEGFEQATSEGTADHAERTPWNAPPEPSEMPRVSLDKTTFDDGFEQVSGLFEEPGDTVPQAAPEPLEMTVTESERNDLADNPTVPFRPASRPSFHETETSQVEEGEEPVQGTIQAEFQCLFAQPGPYQADPDPVSDDWWIVAPDVEPEEDPVAESPEIALHDPWAPLETSDLPEAPEESPVALQAYPDEVQRYFASRVSEDVSEAEKRAARIGVTAWAIAEVNEGRRSQSEISRLLGIGKATVSRWVNAEAEPADIAE